MRVYKKITLALAATVCFNAVGAYGAQPAWELEGFPIRSFYEDFEGYETTMKIARPDGYAHKNRVTNAYGGTEKIIYSANAADNIPVFNDNVITETLNLYYNASSGSVIISGESDNDHIGKKVTLLITQKGFDWENVDTAKIRYIKEAIVDKSRMYKFEVKWPEEYGAIGDYDIKVYANDVTDVLGDAGDGIKPVAVYNPYLSNLQGEALGNNVYTAQAPYGNAFYGGLDGYYGWYGGGLFENYPDPYNSGFVVESDTRSSVGQNETRLAVINEVSGDIASNKLLVMDALYLSGNKNSSGGGHSQVAVFGKHNLDFTGNTEISFRLYPYQAGGSAHGFKMFLTRGEYNMEFEPAFVYDSAKGQSKEYHSPEFYKGSYFAPENKFEMLRFSNSDQTNGDGIYMFKVAGAENRVTGYEFVSPKNTPPTTTTRSDEPSGDNLSPDIYYDIKMDIYAYETTARLYFEMYDNNGELVFSTAPNGVAWEIPSLAEFLNDPYSKFGIVFEAYSSAWAGTSGRTKVGIDNLSFRKKDYVVRNAWLSSKDGIGQVNFDIFNNTYGDTETCVFVAIFDEECNSLKKIMCKSFVLPAMSGADEDTYVDKIVLPADFNAENNCVKLFVLNDVETITPILKDVEIIELY